MRWAWVWREGEEYGSRGWRGTVEGTVVVVVVGGTVVVTVVDGTVVVVEAADK